MIQLYFMSFKVFTCIFYALFSYKNLINIVKQRRAYINVAYKKTPRLNADYG
jgi:hypothetical protein